MTSTIGERLVDMFQPSPNGRHVLNLPALRTLVSWAEGDQALADQFGTWDQGHWARAILGERFESEVGDEMTEDDVFEKTKNGVCESAYCMAGQAVVQAGYRLIYSQVGGNDFQTSDCVKQEYIGRGPDGKPRFRDTGTVISISYAASEVLGMDGWEMEALFDGDNKIDDLKAIINAMCERRSLPVEYHDVDESEFQDDTEQYLHNLSEHPVGAGW